MWYILNLDHHGNWQGIFHKFRSQEKAKLFADTKMYKVPNAEYLRSGRIGYLRWSCSPDTQFAYVIFKSKINLKRYNGHEFDTPEEGTPEEYEFNKTVDNILDDLESKRTLFTDWNAREDESVDERDDVSDFESDDESKDENGDEGNTD